jgi:HSP90 family molecular chaperone
LPSKACAGAATGTGEFEVETITRAERGTDVILHLREGEDEFLSAWKLKSIISKYSDHISLPILMKQGGVGQGEEREWSPTTWETVNKAAALWTRPKADITAEQYHEFYKQLSYDTEAPLAYTHNRVEGRSEYTQLLYIPAKAPFDLWNRDKRGGVKLYVKRVFIMDDAEALMPVYLRFVKGVIDSADLPLNVSRELLQESRDVKAIREGSTKRVLRCWRSWPTRTTPPSGSSTPSSGSEFGAVLKEGTRRRPRQPRASGQAAALCVHRGDDSGVSPCRLREADEGRPGGHLLHHRRFTLRRRTARSSNSSARRASRCCCSPTGSTSGCCRTCTSSKARAAVGCQGRGRPGQAAGRSRKEKG